MRGRTGKFSITMGVPSCGMPAGHMVVTLSLSVNWKVKLSARVIEATSFRVMFVLLILLLAECVYDYRGGGGGGVGGREDRREIGE